MSTPIRPDTGRGGAYSPATDGTGQAPAPEKASVVEDFIDIFYAPSTVFARREKSGFWMHLLIVSLIAGLFAFASRSVTAAIFDAEFARGAAKAMADNPRITQEMMSSQRGIMEKVTTFFTLIGTPLMIFVVALLAWLAGKVVSAKVTYQQAVLIVTLAWVPRLVAGLLTTVQGLIMDPTAFTSMHSVGYGPARFMDPDTTQRQLLGLMGRLDLFTLWVTLLIGIGIAVIAKVPRARGFAAAGIVWLLGTLPMLR
jgi:hypothetical protein